MHYMYIILYVLRIFHFCYELDLISEVNTLKSSSIEKDLVSEKCKEVTLNFFNRLSDKNYIYSRYLLFLNIFLQLYLKSQMFNIIILFILYMCIIF